MDTVKARTLLLPPLRTEPKQHRLLITGRLGPTGNKSVKARTLLLPPLRTEPKQHRLLITGCFETPNRGVHAE